MMTPNSSDPTYLRKLVDACCLLIADEAGGEVDLDALEFAMIRVRNHLTILRARYEDTDNAKTR